MKYPVLGAIYADVLQLEVGRSGYAYLVDGHGQVIYHPDGSEVGRNLAATLPVMRATRGETGTVFTKYVGNKKYHRNEEDTHIHFACYNNGNHFGYNLWNDLKKQLKRVNK